ncbi:MAG: multiheme c-type cytochrome [Sulfurimonadaceae bacterium]|jgi:hypothetical protein|nr:multiheme c-type cytochrome [Sulfurimonadaceae bacterium]
MNRLFFKIFTILAFISGVILLDIFELSWDYFRVIQPLHIIFSSLAFVLFMYPFIYKHIRRFYVVKKVKSNDGWLLAFSFFVVITSGIYLFLVGHRGGEIVDEISYYAHLFGSFMVIILLFLHGKIQKQKKALLALAVLLFLPQKNYALEVSKLSNLTISREFHSEDLANSSRCKECHSEIFDQWAKSNHRHMVSSNPYYMLLETLAGEDEGEEFRAWCMSCHNPSALANGHKKTTHFMEQNEVAAEMFDSESHQLRDDYLKHQDFRLEEGVSCTLCHQIGEVDERGNGSYHVELDRDRYLFEDSRFTIASWLSSRFINANPKTHKDSYSKDFYKDSKYCASCHDEQHPKNGIKIVSTYEEWSKSPYNNPDDKTKHKSCIDCHMSYLKDGKIVPFEGYSTDGGVKKSDVKTHFFTGSNHFLSSLRSKEHEDQTIEMLKSSATMSLKLDDSRLDVEVLNSGAGHHLPTGVADFRELWLEVNVKDKNGALVFHSGHLDENGEIEEGSRLFRKVFGDEDHTPVGLKFWRYKVLLEDTRIPAKKSRVESFVLPKDIDYPIEVEVKLNFRIYPQWVSSATQKLYPMLPNPPVLELLNIKKEFR